MPKLDLPDGRKLAYREEGSGPPLVLVHGSPGEGRSWARVAASQGTLARFVRIHRYSGPDRLGASATSGWPPWVLPWRMISRWSQCV